ncbi:MAG: oxidoreductase [Clostridiales bacterium]|nr:oxidoreductase [Clostridiales bacterium]
MGVCSALYELGGMSVMHDASGCNSTYTTHDEPRWYDTESLVFITAMTEHEALMGDDEKTVRDISEAARQLNPRFIALAGTTIPAMCGIDIPALARLIEAETGIPSFGLPTDGMHSYLRGAALAFDAIASRFVKNTEKTAALSVNILGLTPLDFSYIGIEDSIKSAINAAGIEIISSWAVGSSPEDIEKAASARVNLVVSETGLEAAKTLEKRFGIPYVIGTPISGFTPDIIEAIKTADAEKRNQIPADKLIGDAASVAIIGEYVFASSLCAALSKHGISAYPVCPLESRLKAKPSDSAADEHAISEELKSAGTVIADPLYAPIAKGKKFIPLPHEAYSGRIYRSSIPDLTDSLDSILKELK